ncbi:MAG: hypothetical protein LBS25_07765 [Candidatus Symbiothrix sp.]|jgi:hypothetical protein|nr:hypothetical protein [Candidatus Symbiothrix sp.]
MSDSDKIFILFIFLSFLIVVIIDKNFLFFEILKDLKDIKGLKGCESLSLLDMLLEILPSFFTFLFFYVFITFFVIIKMPCKNRAKQLFFRRNIPSIRPHSPSSLTMEARPVGRLFAKPLRPLRLNIFYRKVRKEDTQGTQRMKLNNQPPRKGLYLIENACGKEVYRKIKPKLFRLYYDK